MKTNPLKITQLQTPARLYVVTETETIYGGRTFELGAGATIWGDFRPDAPSLHSGGGEAEIVQAASFVCRAMQGLARGGRLSLKGFDWIIVSVDEDAAGQVRLQIERVHA